MEIERHADGDLISYPTELSSLQIHLRPITLLAEVSVENLEIMADIGLYDYEIGNPQPLLISAKLRVIPPVADKLKEVLNYEKIRKDAEALGKVHIDLIETFARRLAESCLCHPLVLEADITIRKPHALAGCVAGTRLVLCHQVGAKTGNG